jgi:hypothetical protein
MLFRTTVLALFASASLVTAFPGGGYGYGEPPHISKCHDGIALF